MAWLDNQGIARLNIQNKQLKTFHPDSIGLSNAKVYSITKNGNDLWIGTNNGLNRFNLSSFKVEEIFYEEHGLSNNIVYSLNVDHEGHLWMSTNRGLSKLNTKTKQFSTFLKSDFFMDDASFQAQDGHIYYGGYNGIVHFNPQNIQSSDKSLTPVIENFKLNNKIIKQNETVNNRILFKQAIHHISSLKLSHEENTFTFEFNAIPYDLPNTNQFRYKLENWQNNWQTGNNRSVTFTNVSPGNYRMLLSVCNAENIWSSPKEINIQITPPYWQELWFKLLLIGIITILLVTLYRWRLFRIRQRNILLKRKVKEQTQDILKKSNEIQVISQRLHEADEAKLRFFTNISHEFRTPLTLILGYLEEIEDAGSIQIRKSIKNNALRLLRLVNQLIEFRKLDQDQLKLNITHLEINAFIEDIVISFQKLAEQKNIDLRFEPTPNRLFVWLDMDKTEKIFFNLISNAIKYTPENNPVLISIHENTDTFSIEVADYGIGINEDELTLVFNRFFRSKNSGESGHGIGLALAKGLVDMQHGHIDVQSKIHQGSIFTVQFKKGKDHFKPDDFNQHQQSTLSPEQKTNSPQTMPRVNKSLPTISDKQILLVEDDMELRIYLKKILSDQYAVISANNGQDALDKLEEILPDLIISDISMPVLDGLSFCKKIKENEITSGIPFILLTAKTDSSTRIGSYQLGIDDYIEKPFSKNVLLARVEALLSNREKLQKKPVATRTTASIDKTKLKKRDIQFWKKTNTLINKNYNNPDFTTEILSKKMNMSRSTFYRRFKHISGENAGDYIRKVRLHKAAELLQKKEFSIQQISIEVGFQSTAHFRTKFKEYFGTNPSEYN
ncbi:hybrid sensor histidine kinase/response regulator transcription factor [Saccharicrinis fermentans]|uniref:hybrid sensor histidine kinase/response regulator transcription factor n=1 Tax=Saccharicrinis fermentans TaxID=982 RepID=UPI003908935B